MSSHAETIRRHLNANMGYALDYEDAIAALDALLAENRRLKLDQGRLITRYEAEHQRLRDALEQIERNRDCTLSLGKIAREALAGDAE